MATETATWLNLSSREKAQLVLTHVIDGDDMSALAEAVKAYLHARYGWICVVYRPGEVEFGLEGAGPAGYAAAETTEDAVCLAALRAKGIQFRR